MNPKKTIKNVIKDKAKKIVKKTPTQTKPPAGIKKTYLKNKPICKVTFRLPKIAAQKAKSVYIVGDFNDWSIHTNAMKKNKNGDYIITLELTTDHEYQFRYLIDETFWENDWNADKYVKSPYGDSDNSVVII